MNKEVTPKLLSIILLSYYSRERIRKSYHAVKQLLDVECIPFEFIVMDDGSTDNSYTIALELEKECDNVYAYQLSRNFGAVYSCFAGLSLCSGACALPMPDDEQQPYETIVKMYRLWENGEKIIFPIRATRDDSITQTFFSNLYYKMMNAVSDIQYPPGGADLAFLDREVIDILNSRIHPRNTMFVAEVLNLGYNPYFLPYDRPIGLNKGKSRWTFKKKIRLALDSLFSNSTFPLRLISYMGVLISLLSFIAIVFYGYIGIFGNRQFWGIEIPGWVSLMLIMFMLGGLILLSLGIISEYLWRIYDEVKDRPGYIIKTKHKYL